jgi:ATP-dependent RNA helicase DDX5/DBP2
MIYRNYDADRRGGRMGYGGEKRSRYPLSGRRDMDGPRPLRELPPVEFQKNFYREAEHIRSMTKEEVESFRAKNEMLVRGTDIPNPVASFKDIAFPERVQEGFVNKKFSTPTPIQAQGWPMAFSGRDMVGIAQTGSGKTLSFVLPALTHAKDQQPLRDGDGPIVLILAPTRELVMQIREVASEYCRHYSLRCSVVYGGVPSGFQKQDLSRGVEVLVATPGRLIDLHDQGYAPLGRVTFLVLDEADRMLDMGFEPQLRKIIPKTNPDRQTLMWSATWPKEVKNLAESYMKDYIQVTIGQEDLKTNSKIKQIVEVCQSHEKEKKLLDVLSNYRNERVIIFANMKRTCDDLEYFLGGSGHRASAIHGDKSQNIRDRVIDDFRRGARPVLIATDVAARGLDVKDIKLVINYDFPMCCEDYVHRIGRTARGDTKEGVSHTFFTPNDRGNARELVKMLREAKQTINPELDDLARSGRSQPRSNIRYTRSYDDNRYSRGYYGDDKRGGWGGRDYRRG